jgi:ribonuclease E
MVNDTRSEIPNTDDSGSTAADGAAEKPKRGLRKRVTAAKSAASHVSAGAEIPLDTAPDAETPAPAKRGGGRKKKGDGEQQAAASTTAVDASKLTKPPAAHARAARGSIAPLLFQAPDLPTPSPEAMARPAQNPRGATAQAADDETGGTTRRRTRRRSGDAPREGEDAPNTTVRVRQPRQQQEPKLITEPQRVKGSTRLEAKKQRRRDGRDAGRRRPVVT